MYTYKFYFTGSEVNPKNPLPWSADADIIRSVYWCAKDKAYKHTALTQLLRSIIQARLSSTEARLRTYIFRTPTGYGAARVVTYFGSPGGVTHLVFDIEKLT